MTDSLLPLQIVSYPHPTLRHVSKPIRRFDKHLREAISQMFDLMYDNKGVGLAANQVDLPLRLCVINPTGKRGEGEELALINPVIDRPKGSVAEEEGCLSLPGIYGSVIRSKQLRLSAYDASGNLIERAVEGFLARVIQHELDHLNGVLFFDRMKPEAASELGGQIEELEIDFESRQRTGAIPPNDVIQARIAALEARYA